MRYKIGRLQNSISALELKQRTLYQNTLILGEEGSGKTHLANKIRHYVMANNIPTLYIDFSDPSIEKIEEKFKDADTFFIFDLRRVTNLKRHLIRRLRSVVTFIWRLTLRTLLQNVI